MQVPPRQWPRMAETKEYAAAAQAPTAATGASDQSEIPMAASTIATTTQITRSRIPLRPTSLCGYRRTPGVSKPPGYRRPVCRYYGVRRRTRLSHKIPAPTTPMTMAMSAT